MKNNRFYKAIDEHEKWLNSKKKEGIQLILKNEDLSFIEIINKNLTEAIFENCNLQRVVIENSNFDKAIFNKCEFSYTLITKSKFLNSFFVNNKFVGMQIKNADFKKCFFNKNIYDKCIVENNLFKKSSFYENHYNNSIFKKLFYEDCYNKREKFSKINAESLNFKNTYLGAYIKKSKFINCSAENCYFIVKEEDNIYINTYPEDFFNLQNLYIDNELYYEEMERRVNILEKQILNIKLEENDLKENISNYKMNIINYLNELEKNRYYLEDLNFDKDILKSKLEKLEKLLNEKLQIIMSVNFKGKENE